MKKVSPHTFFAHPTRLGEYEQCWTDLLARRAADDAEREQTDLVLAQVAGEVDAWVTHCSRDLRYLFVNQACAEFLGRPVKLIVGRPIREIIGEAAFQVIRPYVDRVLGGERVEFEAVIPYASTGPRHVHVVYVPGFDLRESVSSWIATIDETRPSVRGCIHRVPGLPSWMMGEEGTYDPPDRPRPDSR